MLGQRIADPDGIEGPPATVPGLGLLNVATTLRGPKRLAPLRGYSVADNVPVEGYEMHMGRTDGPDCARPLLRLDDARADGAVSADGRVCGTYAHGLFADDRQRAAWLARLGATAQAPSYHTTVEAVLDRLAAHLEAHLDVPALFSLAR